MGFNYGAGQYNRVKSCIKFTATVSIAYTTFIWLLLQSFPGFFISIFNSNKEVLEAGIPAMRLFYLGFFIMTLQNIGQSTFVALGKSKYAVFFSIFRKIVLIVPLVIILPRLWGLGASGVFLAEPISELIGATACFITMMSTVYKELKEEPIK
jgi:Na+-driven multidrug efflux pump